MTEIWKPIKDYEELYEISNFGQVRSLERICSFGKTSKRNVANKILARRFDTCGYQMVYLFKNGKGREIKVHLLVWDHFGNSSREGRKIQVDHIDNDKKNNHISNLQLLTNRENCNKYQKTRKNLTSRFEGVIRRRDTGRYSARIYVNGKTINLGCFLSEIEAGLTYQKAKIRYGLY
jgi:hypothetical protein